MLLDAEFKEGDHPRGQPGNKGQFAPSPGGGGSGEAGNAAPGPSKAQSEGKESKAAPEGKIAPRAKQVESTVALNHYLRQIQSIHGARPSPAGFILQHGQPFTANAKTYEGARDAPKQCFKNATLDALKHKDRTYVEGYIQVHGVPIEHAWTVDKTGQIYDTTIRPSQEVSGYFGVPFKTDYVLASSLENKHYGLLGHESRKTLTPLIEGKTQGFKADTDPESLTPDVIASRLAYASDVIRSIKPTDKIDTPERKELREKVANDLYNHNIDKRSRNREATIILGLPGSGKSTFANPLLDSGALEIDPDLVKPKLPEYGAGEGAFAVHEESSTITKNILQRAVQNGDDFVWPRIDSPDKLVKDIKSLKDAGYKVNIKFIDSPFQDAVKNAVSRFLRTGRYVSLETVKSYGDSPRSAYKAALESGLADSTEAYKPVAGHKFEKVTE